MHAHPTHMYVQHSNGMDASYAPHAHAHCFTGAEGNAYLVKDIKTDKLWALKLLKLPLPARFVTSVMRSVEEKEGSTGHTL